MYIHLMLLLTVLETFHNHSKNRAVTQSMDVRKVNKISQKYKDIVYGFVKKVQSLLPKDISFYNIVDLIKNLILLYYHFQFDSKILNDKEKELLRELFLENKKFIIDNDWKLIFKATRDGFKKDNFVSKVHGKSNVIILFHTVNNNLFGGYTKQGWTKEIPETDDYQLRIYSADKDAFIFQIRSSKGYEPFISNVLNDEKSISKAIGYSPSCCYGIFGDEWIFCVYDDDDGEVHTRPATNYQSFKHDDQLIGEKGVYESTHAVEIEVFHML